MSNKQHYWDYWQALCNARPDTITDVMQTYMSEDVAWHGPEPINELHGIEAVKDTFWQPFSRAFSLLQCKPYILFEGQFKGGNWVTSTGCFLGVFTEPWLGIPATKRAVWIRYGDFKRFENGKIVETRIILDIPEVMWQAGYNVFPKYLAEQGFIPGPKTNDGLVFADQDATLTQQSLELVEDMLFKGLSSFDGEDQEAMRQERFWYDDMLWYGPHGIGTTYGLDGFKQDHQWPFLVAFPDRVGGNHNARFAEGHYVASTGWPSLTATHVGNYMGIEGTGDSVTMRVMDWWRADQNLLAENWVFIDMIDLFKQLGVDVFETMQAQIKP